jgi:hypothetical protein
MNKVYLLMFIISGFCACKAQKPFTEKDIVELQHQYTKVDTSNKINVAGQVMYRFKERYFIINNFDDFNDTLVTGYAKKRFDEIDTLIRTIDICFFKASEYTNIEHLQKTPRDIDRYSSQNDLVYRFRREPYKTSPIQMFKYKDGVNLTEKEAKIKITNID